MSMKRHTPAQIVAKLREAEELRSKERSIAEICRKLGISVVTYYRWRKKVRAERFIWHDGDVEVFRRDRR